MINKIKSLKETSFEAITECILIEEGKIDIESGFNFYHRIFNKEGSLLEETILYDGVNKYKTTLFDRTGNIFEIRYFKDDGTLQNKTIFFYDNGHLTESKEVNQDGTEYISSIYKINTKGEKVELRNFTSDGIEWRHIKYDYDERGKVILIEEYSDGTLTGRYQRKYDELGKIIYFSETHWNSPGEFEEVIEYKYDDGKIIQENHFNLKGQLTVKKTKIYNEIGNLIKVETYNYESYHERLVKESFDNNGNLLEITHYIPDEIGRTHHKKYSYDDKNNLINEIEEISNITKIFQYQFDDRGNWIRKTEYYDDEPKFISEREIVYHDSTNVIKSIKEFRFHTVKKYVGEIIKGKRKRQFSGGGDSFTIYDKDGNESEVIWYNSDGSVKSKKSRNYDIDNRKIYEISTDEFDNFRYSIEFKYDLQGNLIEENCSNTDTSIDDRTYGYDINGNRTEINIFSFYDGDLRDNIENKYDNNNNLIESIVFRLGIFTSKTTFKYDQNNFEIEKKRMDNDGNLTEKSTHKYDDKGNVIELLIFKSGTTFDKKYMYYYDEKDNLVEGKRYNSEDIIESVTNYRYCYDDKGNWVEKVVIENNIPSSLVSG